MKVHLTRAFVSIPHIHSSQIEKLREICGVGVAINGPYGDGHFEVMWANQSTEFLERLKDDIIPKLDNWLSSFPAN